MNIQKNSIIIGITLIVLGKLLPNLYSHRKTNDDKYDISKLCTCLICLGVSLIIIGLFLQMITSDKTRNYTESMSESSSSIIV